MSVIEQESLKMVYDFYLKVRKESTPVSYRRIHLFIHALGLTVSELELVSEFLDKLPQTSCLCLFTNALLGQQRRAFRQDLQAMIHAYVE